MTAIETVVAPSLAPMFSADAIRYGDLLFVSGCVAWDKDGTLVGPGDMEKQTRATLDNLRHVLESAGSGFEHVLKTTVYLTDLDQRGVTHAIRKEVFGERPPASTMIGVTGLGGEGLMIEIDAIAVVPRENVP